MARALVNLGRASQVADKLKPAQQLFLARWLQLFHDETHPRWALRPLSLGNLSALSPQVFQSLSKQFVFALEDELARRVEAQERDVEGVAHHPPHSTEYRQRVSCINCSTLLGESQTSRQERLLNLAERLLKSIESDDVPDVLVLTPCVAAEAVASGVSPRFMMQTCRNYVLDPNMARTEPFTERLRQFLCHDVGLRSRHSERPPADLCEIRRELMANNLPSAAWIPYRMGTHKIGFFELERPSGQSSRRLWLSLDKVEDRLRRREAACTQLRSLTPGWLALLRFCFPSNSIVPSGKFDFGSLGRSIECPDHRRVFSHRKAKRAIPALELLIEDDDVRASLYWLSLAYQVWGESVAHAAGMVWMSIESLVGDGGVRMCAEAYVGQLQSLVADDISETLGTIAGDVASRRKGHRAPQWLRTLPSRQTATSDQAWLTDLAHVAPSLEPGVRFVVCDAASLSEQSARHAAFAQTMIDLHLLRSVRHAVAHTGKSIAEEPLMHYLATLGCECIRALLARRLEGSAYEGVIENRPTLSMNCELVSEHRHLFVIPTWTTARGDVKYMSALAGSEAVAGHKHELILSADARAQLAREEHIEVCSLESAGHCHTVRLSKAPLSTNRRYYDGAR
jgi:hypothetical protein